MAFLRNKLCICGNCSPPRNHDADTANCREGQSSKADLRASGVRACMRMCVCPRERSADLATFHLQNRRDKCVSSLGSTPPFKGEGTGARIRHSPARPLAAIASQLFPSHFRSFASGSVRLEPTFLSHSQHQTWEGPQTQICHC